MRTHGPLNPLTTEEILGEQTAAASAKKRIARTSRPRQVSQRPTAVARRTKDEAWRAEVKRRAYGVCEYGRCFRSFPLDAHHIHGKKAHPRLRHLTENGAALCREHHDFAHRNRDVFRDWWAETHPRAWGRLQELKSLLEAA